MMPYIRSSHYEDIPTVAESLRLADRLELVASGTDPVTALEVGYMRGAPCLSIVLGGTPIAMFGVVPQEERIGTIWLLGTRDIEKIWLPFLRQSRPVLQGLFRGYDVLHNRLHVDNAVHRRWLSWLGFRAIRQQDSFIEFAKTNV